MSKYLAACAAVVLTIASAATATAAPSHARANGTYHRHVAHHSARHLHSADRTRIYVSRQAAYRPFYFRSIPTAGPGYLGFQCGPVPDPYAAARPDWDRTCY
jgi:hypothetical protein